jgi:hypothetical protein
MPYSAPDRATLRASVARDLRDPDLKTFTSNEVNDLINLAIVEVARVYPKEDVRELAVASDKQRQFACDAQSIFRVEVIKDAKVYLAVPHNDSPEHSEAGWDLHAGILWIPTYTANGLTVEGSPTVRVWGYWTRELMTADASLLDGDAEVEFGVRAYAVMSGYQRLQNDRLLFQQWLTNTGNTDVSPNQLAQTADLYAARWADQRNRMRKVQRT